MSLGIVLCLTAHPAVWQAVARESVLTAQADMGKQFHCCSYRGDFGYQETASAIHFLKTASVNVCGSKRDNLVKGMTAKERTICIMDEIQSHTPFLEHNTFGTKLTTEPAQGHHPNEFLSLGRNGAESVQHPLAKSLHLLISLKGIQFTIEQHAFG